jgi:hypothetical protein
MFVLQKDSVIDGLVYLFIQILGRLLRPYKRFNVSPRSLNLVRMNNVDVASIKDMPQKSLTMIDLEMNPIHPKVFDTIINYSRIGVNCRSCCNSWSHERPESVFPTIRDDHRKTLSGLSAYGTNTTKKWIKFKEHKSGRISRTGGQIWQIQTCLDLSRRVLSIKLFSRFLWWMVHLATIKFVRQIIQKLFILKMKSNSKLFSRIVRILNAYKWTKYQ